MGTSLRRIIGAALSGVVIAGTASVLTAPAASATLEGLRPSAMSYVDSVTPKLNYAGPGDELPVGARVYADGKAHVTKSYVTFDLTPYRGLALGDATLQGVESRATDCTNPRATEVFLADTLRKPTWLNQPAEHAQLPLGYAGSDCAHTGISWTATDAVHQAVAAGQQKVTFVLRLPDDKMTDPAYSRGYGPDIHLTITVNHPPDRPANLQAGTRYDDMKACGTKPVQVNATTLQAFTTDPDNDTVSGEFVWWPTDQPAARHTLTGQATGPTAVTIPSTDLTDGTTYSWQVRGVDAYGAGPWSAVCSFTLDKTAPAAAPLVSSTDYPSATTGPGSGGTDVPGLFTFQPNGGTDVVGYYYRFGYGGLDEYYVPASRKGGPATTKVTPTHYGADVLMVHSVDGAGNESPYTNYPMFIAYNGPTLTCTPLQGYLGQPRTCTLTPGSGGATAYVYSFIGDHTVAPDADGTATFTVTPTPDTHYPEVKVHAVLPNGQASDETSVLLGVDPADPVIDEHPDQVVFGTPLPLTVHPVLPDSQTVTYVVDYGDPQTVPAGPDGTVTITVVPPRSGWVEVDVFSTNSAGMNSGTTSEVIEVLSNAPTVSSDVYPEYTTAGGVGVPGTFTLRSSVPGAVSFTYQHTGEAAATVPADADGTASITLTPVQEWGQDLLVTATFADGSVSEQTDYYFVVAPAGFAGAPDATPLRSVAT